MKIRNIKFAVMSLFVAFTLHSCTIETDDDTAGDLNAQITGYETNGGWIFGELYIEGVALDENCANNSVTLSDASSSISLDIVNCTSNEIAALIPADASPGSYSITVGVNGNNFSSIDGMPLEVEVKERPVILSMSKTSMEDGETITLSGLNLLNPTSLPQNEPKVWIMKSGYTNTVSDISVNSSGTSATVTIDEGIDAGEYRFLLTTKEWSNEIMITIL